MPELAERDRAPPQVWCLNLGVGRRCFADAETCQRRAALAERAGAPPQACVQRQTF